MTIEAYILAGGRSRRFAGGEKQLARFQGRTLTENACNIVQSAFPDSPIYLVARDTEHLADEASRLGIRRISDPIEGRGPLGGLFAGLTHCDSDWLFLFACDMPLVTPEIITKLSGFCEPGVGVVIPRQPDGKLQPLCAFYNVSEARPVVEALIHRPDGTAALVSVVEALEARIVESAEIAADGSAWANVNTVNDLIAAGKI